MKGRRRILIIHPHKLGDMLLLTPMLAGLRSQLPDSELEIWVSAGTEGVLAGNADVNRVEIRDKKLPHKKIVGAALEMRRKRFDTVLMPHGNNGNYTIAAYLARVPRRIGWSVRWYKRLLTQHTKTTGTVHMVDRWLELGSLAADATLSRSPVKFLPSGADREIAKSLKNELGLENGGFCCMHAGTGGSGLAWGMEHYTRLARMVIAQIGLKVVFVGGPNDVATAEELVRAVGTQSISIAGRTTFGALAAFLDGNQCFISGSTGTLHLAASQGNPCVLIEPTAPANVRAARWTPWMTESRVICARKVCQGCELDCDQSKMDCRNSIRPEEVAQAVAELISCRVSA